LTIASTLRRQGVNHGFERRKISVDAGDDGDAHRDVMMNARFDHIHTRATVLAAEHAAVLFESLSMHDSLLIVNNELHS